MNVKRAIRHKELAYIYCKVYAGKTLNTGLFLIEYFYLVALMLLLIKNTLSATESSIAKMNAAMQTHMRKCVSANVYLKATVCAVLSGFPVINVSCLGLHAKCETLTCSKHSVYCRCRSKTPVLEELLRFQKSKVEIPQLNSYNENACILLQ